MTPVLVPHRDEYSETVGYYIKGQNKTALYIPDMTKWSAWEQNILAIIPLVDYAFIDGTFYEDGEVPRPMAEVPHPFISESVLLLQHLTQKTVTKFILFTSTTAATRNKTNPGRMAIETSGLDSLNSVSVLRFNNPLVFWLRKSSYFATNLKSSYENSQ